MPPEEVLVVETPEQTRLEYPLAGVGSRALALLIDTLIQIVLTVMLFGLVLLFLSVSNTTSPSSGPLAGEAWVYAIVVLLLFVVQFGLFAGFEAAWHGQTPGKRRMGLRVIKVTGRPIEMHEALTRNLLRVIDSLPGMYGVGVLTVLLTARRQRLGDLAAGTVVVHERTYDVAPFDWSLEPAAMPAATARRDVLTREELGVVEAFLQRRTSSELPSDVRSRLAITLADRIGTRLGVPPDERRDSEAWLEQMARRSREVAGYR